MRTPREHLMDSAEDSLGFVLAIVTSIPALTSTSTIVEWVCREKNGEKVRKKKKKKEARQNKKVSR
jgi:hypothetical protein